MPSIVKDGEQRGWIIPIGGAEEKENKPEILRRFVQLSGGDQANIVVIPTASRMSDTGARYERIFSSLGVGKVSSLNFDTRRDCEEEGRLECIEQATGVFMTGGNQLRLSTMLGGTSVAKLLRKRNAAGVHMAGTSAGAAFVSEHMIAFGEEGSSPIAGSGAPGAGAGLDQPFHHRPAFSPARPHWPAAHGAGLQPVCCRHRSGRGHRRFHRPDNTLEVEGSGAITIVDANEMQFSSMDQIEEGRPVCMLGLKLHILVAGASFNLQTRQASAELDAASRRRTDHRSLETCASGVNSHAHPRIVRFMSAPRSTRISR